MNNLEEAHRRIDEYERLINECHERVREARKQSAFSEGEAESVRGIARDMRRWWEMETAILEKARK